MISKFYLYTLQLAICILFFTGCRNNDCFTNYDIPVSPYSSPVWYVDGNMLGFNYIPVKEKITESQGSCDPLHSYTYYADSIGFWMINRDGTNKRRQTRFLLDYPAWSPDGKWLAYSFQDNLYKMPFDGHDLDTAGIIQLTSDDFKHFFPTWNSTSDTIFYDCNKDQPANTISYQVWKMAADGTGAVNIGNKGVDSISTREPWCTPENSILHVRPADGGPQIFIMNSQGDAVSQITDNADPSLTKHNPRMHQDKIYFENNGIWRVNMDGSSLTKIVMKSEEGFSISADGTIAYVNFSSIDPSVIDHVSGTIWTISVGGSNNKQLTFNNYIEH